MSLHGRSFAATWPSDPDIDVAIAKSARCIHMQTRHRHRWIIDYWHCAWGWWCHWLRHFDGGFFSLKLFVATIFCSRVGRNCLERHHCRVCCDWSVSKSRTMAKRKWSKSLKQSRPGPINPRCHPTMGSMKCDGMCRDFIRHWILK